MFEFPEGIGTVECVNVEHEEVVLIPRWVDCERVTFKYGLGQEFIEVLSTLHKLGLDSTEPVSVRGVRGRPARRGRRRAARPGDARRAHDRAHLRGHLGDGHRHGRRSRARPTSTTWSTTSTTMREYGSQAVVWQTAINPVVALELLDRGDWKGTGRARPRGLPAGAVPGAARRVRLTARADGAAAGRRTRPRTAVPARLSARVRGTAAAGAQKSHARPATGPVGGGVLEQVARRRDFGLAREVLAEVRAARPA